MENFHRKSVLIAILTFLIIYNPVLLGSEGPGRIVLREGFETGLPSGWIQEYANSPFGFNANWNTRRGAGFLAHGIMGDPDTAAVGTRNLVFQYEGIGHVTNLITVPINLEFIVKPELTFWHAQNKWGVDGPDQLWIHYREGNTGPWVPLTPTPFTTPVEQWTHRSFLLPSGSDKFYLRLQGTSLFGMGICIDDFTITETGVIPRALSQVVTTQASTRFVATGSRDNVVLRSEFRVTGNSGELRLQNYRVRSGNTNDQDIAPSGIKLYFTESEVFHTNNLVATATGFSGGEVAFNNLNLLLPTGYSYLWVVMDVKENATAGNVIDAFIPANGIFVSGGGGFTVPTANQNPPGWREIFKTIFHDDFETSKGWTLTGEWEIDTARGLPAFHGFPNPANAFDGRRILGSDISGLGAFPGMYEPGLDSLAYQAISPSLNCFYYTNVILTFQEWLNIEFTDKAYIHVSADGGVTWNKIWENNNFFNATNWNLRSFSIPGANRKENVRIRFGLGPTDNSTQHSGWNIDNVSITGTFVTRDVGVSHWIGPVGRCGMTNDEKITVRIANYGAGSITGPIPIRFSLNGGQTWQTDIVNQNIPVGGSVVHTFAPGANFSTPGHFNNIIVRTLLDGDQDDTNDALNHRLFSVPTFTPPYSQSFALNDGLWNSYGNASSWQRATPSGTVINQAHNDLHAWITNAAGPYNSDEASWLETPCFNFSALETPVLEFHINHHTPQGVDGASMQYTLDNGATWHPVGLLAPQFAWNWYNPGTVTRLNQAFAQPQGWHGNSNGWRRARAVLNNQVAQKGQVRFRFIFAASNYPAGTNTWEGVAIDAFNTYQAPSDVGVTQLVSPSNSCELSTQQAVTIRIQNHGHNTLVAGTTIPVGINVNTLVPVFENKILDSNLPPGQSTTFTFNTKFDLSQIRTHAITAYTQMPGDTDFFIPGVFNDTLVAQVTVFGYTAFSLGNNIYTTRPDTVAIDAGAGFQAYLWNNGSTNRIFDVTSLLTSDYSVIVTDNNGCNSTDTVKVIAYDLSLTTITEPISDCQLSNSEIIRVSIQNSGPDVFGVGTQIPLQLHLNGNLHNQGTLVLTTPLNPGASVSHTFGVPVDFTQVGEYRFMVRSLFPDANPSNNTLNQSIFVHGFPVPAIPDTLYSTAPIGHTLDAGPGFVQYLWQDGSTGQTFVISSPGNALYTVSIVDVFGCPGNASTRVIAHDIALTGISRPIEACQLSLTETIEVVLRNNGPGDFTIGHSIPLIVEINGVRIFEEQMVLTQNWLTGTDYNYAFSQKVNLNATGVYQIRVFQKHRDAIAANDTRSISLRTHGFPVLEMPHTLVTNEPDTITLDAGPGHTTYRWSDASTVQTFQVPAWGEYWVDVTNSFGCITRDTVRVVPVKYGFTVSEIISPSNFCLNAINQPVEIILQNTGNATISAGTSVTVQFLANATRIMEEEFTLQTPLAINAYRNFVFTGRYTSSVSGSVQLRAEIPFQSSLEKNITVHPNPVVNLGNDIYTTRRDTVVLNAGSGFAAYLWHNGATTQQYIPATFGWKWVTVRDGFGCMAGDTLFLGLFVSTENFSTNLPEVLIYPNPATNILNIRFTGFDHGEVTIGIYDMLGGHLLTDVLHPSQQPVYSLDTSTLERGVYFIRFRSTLYNNIHKFTKIR